MLIYAVADIHGQAERLDIVEETAAAMCPDVIVVAGDITGYARDRETLRRLDKMTCPVLFIPGNIDPATLADAPSDGGHLVSLCRRCIEIQGLPFYGLDVADPAADAERIDHRTVLVSHCPPRGVLDRGYGGFPGGSPAVLQLVLEKRPLALICGHIHEQRGVSYCGETLVVNCSMGHTGAGARIELDGAGVVRAKLMP